MTEDAGSFFDALKDLGEVLAVKLYRLRLDPAPRVPVLPCLDHEALLHEGIAPHAAAYLRDRRGDLHEVVYTPKEKRIEVDVVSTMNECSPESHAEFMAALKTKFTGYDVSATDISWLKGDKRVATACRAQVTLRDVLTGPDLERTRQGIERLHVIGTLMEKQSRVTSWGVRTAMTPLLAIGLLLVLSSLGGETRADWITIVRYVLTIAGAFFLYSGLKAVHLTEMASRVWKRAAEYGLILSERQRLQN